MNSKENAPLPSLKQLLPLVFKTILRSKNNMGQTDFFLRKSYYLNTLDDRQWRRYTEYFDFPSTERIPLSYLYLVAQRAQVALMTDRGFPLPVPGMVHFNNRLFSFSPVNSHQPIRLDVSIFIGAKASGSLFPEVKVSFWQEDEEKAICESGYFVRRKSSKKKQKKAEEEFSIPDKYANTWLISGSSGWEYARLSGDYNPIHLSRLFALLSGFKGRIIHGWYSLSRTVALIEKQMGEPCRQIDVEFKKPIPIPGRAVLNYGQTGEHIFQFVLRCEEDGRIFMIGKTQS